MKRRSEVAFLYGLLRVSGNGRLLSAWKVVGFVVFRRCALLEPTRKAWGRPRRQP